MKAALLSVLGHVIGIPRREHPTESLVNTIARRDAADDLSHCSLRQIEGHPKCSE